MTVKIVVQKFGGTSVNTRELREKAALKVQETQKKDFPRWWWYRLWEGKEHLMLPIL